MRFHIFADVKFFASILLALFLLYTGCVSFSYLFEDGDVVELAEEEETEEETAEEYEYKIVPDDLWRMSDYSKPVIREFISYYFETYKDVVIPGEIQPPELIV